MRLTIRNMRKSAKHMKMLLEERRRKKKKINIIERFVCLSKNFSFVLLFFKKKWITIYKITNQNMSFSSQEMVLHRKYKREQTIISTKLFPRKNQFNCFDFYKFRFSFVDRMHS